MKKFLKKLAPYVKSANITHYKTIKMVGNKTTISEERVSIKNVTGIGDYEKQLLKALMTGQALNTGPVLIKDVHIRIKKQRGFNANFRAGDGATNDMSGSFHHNDQAGSDDGSVLRMDGVAVDNVLGGKGSEN